MCKFVNYQIVLMMITCEEKFSRVKAAVKVDFTAERYGLSVFD